MVGYRTYMVYILCRLNTLSPTRFGSFFDEPTAVGDTLSALWIAAEGLFGRSRLFGDTVARSQLGAISRIFIGFL